MASNKYETYVRIERHAHEKLEFIAKKQHRSVNSLIVHYIMSCIEDYEEQNGEIKLADD